MADASRKFLSMCAASVFALLTVGTSIASADSVLTIGRREDGTTFAEIFFNNCFKNGVLPIKLAQAEIDALFAQALATPGYELAVDLDAQTVTRPDGKALRFDIDPFRKYCLLNGLDDIGLTLRHAEIIKEFEAKRRAEQPWLFA